MDIKKRLTILSLFVALLFFASPNEGFTQIIKNTELRFHGQAQTTAIVRDIDGFQNRILNDNQWVQWRTQLKFDLDLIPEYVDNPAVRVSRLFLSYRGAYDTIFDMTSRYNDVPDERTGGNGSRYDLGKDDVRYENDLREAFIDVMTTVGGGILNGRLGRQITQWGEADMFNLINVINPSDYRGFGAFANPDDLANPIWMGRFDYTLGTLGMFDSVSVQILAIPDNRPSIFGPATATASAPYALYVPGLNVYQNDNASDLGNMQFGYRLGLVKDYLQTFLYYFNGFQAGPAVNTSMALSGDLYLDHPRYEMFGLSFNYNSEQVLKGVLRGEFSLSDITYGDASVAQGYEFHKTYKAMIGFDKTLHPKFLGTDSALPATVQLFYTKINDWDYDPALRSSNKDEAWRLTVSGQTDYYHGTITPGLAYAYDFEGVSLIVPYITYSPDGRWFAYMSSQIFLGDKNAVCDLVSAIGSTEMVFRVGYRW